jgi:hypothetical protein
VRRRVTMTLNLPALSLEISIATPKDGAENAITPHSQRMGGEAPY